MTEEKILEEKSLNDLIDQLAEKIATRVGSDLCFVGIYTRGVYIAKRIAQTLSHRCSKSIEVGELNINLYRDDYSSRAEQPIVGPSKIDRSITKRPLVLIDDVLYTGRSIRCALDALLDFGRPKRVWLAVLIDRGYRELPINADFVGLELKTAKDQEVIVRLKEVDGVDEVVLGECAK